ncbi:MAG: hypothetical protein U1F53_12240 [Burkholderiaceae bacterium]
MIVFDRERRIDTVNSWRHAHPARAAVRPSSAARWARCRARPISPTACGSASTSTRPAPEDGERDHWQDAFELNLGSRDHLATTLLVRGAPLPGRARSMVFDDITEVVSAQRTAAWGEVARRLAHTRSRTR